MKARLISLLVSASLLAAFLAKGGFLGMKDGGFG